jgi:predicted Fe-S protein YdhL (DUF1289 family)
MTEVPSPCQRICTLDFNTEQCSACKRTLVEIECWQIYTDSEKLAILEEIKGR